MRLLIAPSRLNQIGQKLRYYFRDRLRGVKPQHGGFGPNELVHVVWSSGPPSPCCRQKNLPITKISKCVATDCQLDSNRCSPVGLFLLK